MSAPGVVDPDVVRKLETGDRQFGHAGTHRGTGAPDCPRERHHHHDKFCRPPSDEELRAAGVDPATFKPASRAGASGNVSALRWRP